MTGTLPVNVMFTCDGEEEQGSPHFHQVLDRYRDRLRRADALLMNPLPSQGPDGSVTMYLGSPPPAGADWATEAVLTRTTSIS